MPPQISRSSIALTLRSIQVCLFRLGWLLTICLISPASAQTQVKLPTSVEQLLVQAGISPDTLSVSVMNADSGKPLIMQHAERSMSPASTMKLLTTWVALDQLGPNFRWKTSLLSAQKAERGVLQGDLYLRGGGDPNLSWEQLAILLRQLRNLGIRHLDGDLILDRSYFQPARPDLGATPFDDAPNAYYNVIPDALLINGNLITLALDADAEVITARLNTPLADLKIKNRLSFADVPCANWDQVNLLPRIKIQRRQQIELTLHGSFPKNCQTTANINLLDRNRYIESMVRTLWEEIGGHWRGHAKDGVTPADANLLVEHKSASLAEIIRITNKYSDNSMARMLYLTLGAESPNELNDPSIPIESAAFTAAKSARRIQSWLAQHQIDERGIVLDNGSGLSRREQISSAQLAQVLAVGWHHLWLPEFASSLPIAALDGTMRKRLKASPAEFRARIKTGTLKNALAIAGYVRDLNQQNWIIVAIINDEKAAQGKAVLDQLISWLASGEFSSVGQNTENQAVEQVGFHHSESLQLVTH